MRLLKFFIIIIKKRGVAFLKARYQAEDSFALGTLYRSASEEERSVFEGTLSSRRQFRSWYFVHESVRREEERSVLEGTPSSRRKFRSWYFVQDCVRRGA